MVQIEKSKSYLPATIEGLNTFILIGKEKLNAHKAKIRAIDKTGMAVQAREAALEDAQDMADILLDAEMKMGEILEAIPDKEASSAKGTRTLPDNVTKKQSHQAQTLSQHRDIVEKVKAEARDNGEIPTANRVYKIIKDKPHVSFNSGENEWYTPSVYIESARKVMGSIDCDPASSDVANRIVKAKTYYTKETDGLNRPWLGNVWMNPPYGQPLINQFINKFIEKFEEQETNQACVLVNNATETEWCQALLVRASTVCFIKGRIKYLDANGQAANSPLQGQVILYFGSKTQKFRDVFNQFGIVMCHEAEL